MCRVSEQHIHVSNESPFVVKHHTNWRVKSLQKMDYRQNDELFFTAPTMITKADFEKIGEKLNKTIQDFIEICKESPAGGISLSEY